MQNLSSRKLIAALGGVIAVCVVSGFVVFGGALADFDKVLLAITTITLAAVGAQAIVDSKANGSGPDA